MDLFKIKPSWQIKLYSLELVHFNLCSVKGTIERYKKAYSSDTGHASSSNELNAQVKRIYLITKMHWLFGTQEKMNLHWQI
jgi:hypothetical protein